MFSRSAISRAFSTALLTTFLARTAQTHQQQLITHSGTASYGYNQYIGAATTALQQQGMTAAQAAQAAVGYAYQQMLRQASMLSYKNAFALLAGVIFCLIPLPFLMRLPTKAAKPSPEQMGHYQETAPPTRRVISTEAGRPDRPAPWRNPCICGSERQSREPVHTRGSSTPCSRLNRKPLSPRSPPANSGAPFMRSLIAHERDAGASSRHRPNSCQAPIAP